MKFTNVLYSPLIICCSRNNLTTNAFLSLSVRDILFTRAVYITSLRFTKELCDDMICNNCINIEHFQFNPVHFISIGMIIYFNHLFYKKELPTEQNIEKKIATIDEYNNIKQDLHIIMLTCFIIFFKNIDIVL
jgi:hypothetical protein